MQIYNSSKARMADQLCGRLQSGIEGFDSLCENPLPGFLLLI